jgi:arylsulfatase A-like enzyme
MLARTLVTGLAVLLPGSALGNGPSAPTPPNVLFISMDDLNDWISPLDPQAQPHTPNFARLAARSVTFTRAYCDAPMCNPSRTAVLTGLRPSTTGVYGNHTDWRRMLPDIVTLPALFRQAGYHAVGAGKVYHHVDRAYHDERSFQQWLPFVAEPLHRPRHSGRDYAEFADGTREVNAPTFDWGPTLQPEHEMLDERSTRLAEAFLTSEHDRPFFLAVGYYRPHLPYYVPQRYLDRWPAHRVRLPEVKADDLDDIPAAGLALHRAWRRMFGSLMSAPDPDRAWREAIAAYCAAIEYVDDLLGRLLDALDRSAYADNTVIVLWSDHGYHLGEKHHWTKFVLWERSVKVPLLIAAPGVARAGGVCGRTVALTDLFPTLVELAGLEAPHALDGRSLVPLLRDPAAPWDRPALTTEGPGNHTVRDERWRYIRYADGGEELYDHETDPHEWTNLAGDPAHAATIARLAAWLPRTEAPMGPNLADR